MDFRRNLRHSAAIALGAFFLALVGSILWIFDEYLYWDILPDWLENCAMAIVTILLVVSVFAVLTNFVSAVTVVADSLAERCVGPVRTGASRRPAIWIGIIVAALLAVLAGFQQISKVRTRRQDAARIEKCRAEDRELCDKLKASLQDSVAESAAKFPDAMAATLASAMSSDDERNVAEFLRSLAVSIQYAPSVKMAIRGEPPYVYQSISALRSWSKDENGKVRHLGRENLVDLPSVWERDTVAALFEGAKLDVPHGRGGAIIDTKEPCAWSAIERDGKVVGLLIFRVDDRNRFRKGCR